MIVLFRPGSPNNPKRQALTTIASVIAEVGTFAEELKSNGVQHVSIILCGLGVVGGSTQPLLEVFQQRSGLA